VLGLAPGDATLALRFALCALASAGVALALAATARAAFATWLALIVPALLFVPGFPALLAPFGMIPLYAGALRARTGREAAILGGGSGTAIVIGASGWIFHYFERPFLPGLLAFAIAWALWGPVFSATRALVRRSPLWIPAVAALIPLTEMIRGEWMNPPLPGLLIAHANADTALIRLAPWVGEVGVTYAAALLGLVGAYLLDARRPRAIGRLAPLALAFAALAALRPAGEVKPARPVLRVCAIADPLRTRGGDAFGGAGEAGLFALADRARELGCAVVGLPEYSLRIAPRQVVPAEWGGERAEDEMVVIAGAAVVSSEGGLPSVRNVVCRLYLGTGRQINCAGAYDKLVPAPFGESDLFQGVPALAWLGARLSREATGAKHPRVTSVQPVGLLPLGGGRRAGVAICWEILVPRIFERRGVRPGSADLLAAVSDLDGFGGSHVAVDHLRRAASLHAASLRAPLLFASTHDPFLVTADGRVAAPVHRDPFVTAWDIPW
jgi:Apolipoprotein N-acyltransferase N-terminal domain